MRQRSNPAATKSSSKPSTWVHAPLSTNRLAEVSPGVRKILRLDASTAAGSNAQTSTSRACHPSTEGFGTNLVQNPSAEGSPDRTPGESRRTVL
jgi:hypothetical protein